MFNRLIGLWLTGPLILVGCAGQPLTVVRSLTMTEPNFELGELTPQAHFSMKDVIRVEAFLSWPDPSNGDVLHDVEWDWYRSGVLVSRTKRDNQRFDSTPYGLWTRRAAAGLGPGDYRVDTLVDGKPVVSNQLVIDAA